MSDAKFSAFDASKYLDTQEAMNDYLAIALEDGDTTTVQVVLRDIARARKVNTCAMPLSLDYERPNEESLAAIRETEKMVSDGTGQGYSSGSELIDAVLGE